MMMMAGKNEMQTSYFDEFVSKNYDRILNSTRAQMRNAGCVGNAEDCLQEVLCSLMSKQFFGDEYNPDRADIEGYVFGHITKYIKKYKAGNFQEVPACLRDDSDREGMTYEEYMYTYAKDEQSVRSIEDVEGVHELEFSISMLKDLEDDIYEVSGIDIMSVIRMVIPYGIEQDYVNNPLLKTKDIAKFLINKVRHEVSYEAGEKIVEVLGACYRYPTEVQRIMAVYA